MPTGFLGVTERRFPQDESYDHWVRSEQEFGRIRTYIEMNPVSAGLVRKAEEWPWTSAGKYRMVTGDMGWLLGESQTQEHSQE